jgi:hypothetical protein
MLSSMMTVIFKLIMVERLILRPLVIDTGEEELRPDVFHG